MLANKRIKTGHTIALRCTDTHSGLCVWRKFWRSRRRRCREWEEHAGMFWAYNFPRVTESSWHAWPVEERWEWTRYRRWSWRQNGTSYTLMKKFRKSNQEYIKHFLQHSFTYSFSSNRIESISYEYFIYSYFQFFSPKFSKFDKKIQPSGCAEVCPLVPPIPTLCLVSPLFPLIECSFPTWAHCWFTLHSLFPLICFPLSRQTQHTYFRPEKTKTQVLSAESRSGGPDTICSPLFTWPTFWPCQDLF